ncbi:MAG: glycosyltransferase family 4 protein [Bacilli bacterium]|nr:glycosyltransferase family 4 protein [Bacilli bacterium]
MRIGIFTDTYPPYINGVSTSIAMLEKALKKKGHKVYIVTVNPEERSYSFTDHVIKIPGIPIGIYDYRLSNIYPLKAVKKIKEWNLDIIHSHTEFGIGTFARVMAHQLDIPLVHTYHTMYEDYVYYVTKGYFDKSSKKIVEYLTKFYCDKTATELIVPTKKTYDLFKEKYGYARSVHIVPTGIDVEKFYPEKNNQTKALELRRKLGIKDDEFVILFVGRMGNEKSVDFLIENHKAILKENKKARLLLIGDGPDIDNLKDITKKNKLEDSVIFAGRVPWENISLYYQIPDVFTTASKTETQGLTVLEAMAAGLPVVALDDDAFREVVSDDYNGFLFKDKKGYVDAMAKIMKDPNLRDRLAVQARNTVEAHSAKYFAEQVLDVYKKALKSRKLKGKKTFLNKMVDVFKRGLDG